jgi:predicted amidohydrolase YtcJ
MDIRPRTRRHAILHRVGLAHFLGLIFALTACGNPSEPPPTLFLAERIITMDAARPSANAVAVRGGRIVDVGEFDVLRSRLNDGSWTIDRRFQGKTLLPGFIDPHIHPTLAGTILPMNIVSAMEWQTPRGRTRAALGRDAFLARLRELQAEMTSRGEADDAWLLVWGYHRPYHGSLSRADLDAISGTRPIMVWQRSVHEMYFNTPALDALELSAEDFAGIEQSDWDTGHIWEAGLFSLARPMMRILAAPLTFRRGLSMMSEVIARGGLTTVAEQGFPQMSAMGEWLMLRLEMWGDETPYRFVLVPNAMYLMNQHEDARAAEAEAASWLDWSTPNVRVIKHVKYYADGAIYSQLMQMSEPYLDGHHGEWLMPPERQADVLETFWRRGWDIHIHVNGDAGLDVVLEQISRLRASADGPRPRVILEHYGYAREDQHARLAELDIAVSSNAYYLYELAPIYAEDGLGPERAADIAPLGGLVRAGVPFSFHSDFPMAPAEPLRLIWVAVNRLASDGQVWGAGQRIALDRALRAVTLEAAWSLGMEDEIGSIEVGKRADFTVLERDPYAVDPTALADIPIWGTVLDGRPTALSPTQIPSPH